MRGLNRASSPANGVAANVGDAGVEYEIGADKSGVLGRDCDVGGPGGISSTFESVSTSLDITHRRRLMPGLGHWISDTSGELLRSEGSCAKCCNVSAANVNL